MKTDKTELIGCSESCGLCRPLGVPGATGDCRLRTLMRRSPCACAAMAAASVPQKLGLCGQEGPAE